VGSVSRWPRALEGVLGIVAETHGFCRPSGVLRAPVPGGWVWDAPPCRDAWSAHRVELVAGGVEEGLRWWEAHHAGKGLARVAITVEGPPALAAPPGWSVTRQVVLVHSGAPEVGDAALPVRPADPGRVADWIAAHRVIDGPAYARALRWWLGGLAANGAVTWVAWDGSEPAATVTLVPGPAGVGRLQEVFTAPGWRRRGLARALLSRALQPVERAVLAVDAGSAAERCYRALGFSEVGRLGWFTRPVSGR
jgi:GNAT superfamily N-acetyltransferase